MDSIRKGIKARGPSFSFLFIIAMEGLSSMLRISTANGDLRGFTIQNRENNLEISHLLYVDDALILCDAEPSQLMHLRLILTIFEGISGLHVNWRKSQMFPIYEAPNCPILAGILAARCVFCLLNIWVFLWAQKQSC